MAPIEPFQALRLATAGAVLALSTACTPPVAVEVAPPPPPPPFTFESAGSQAVGVRVTSGGAPVAFAIVTVADVAPAPEEDPAAREDGGPAVYLQGATDADGWLRADVRIPNRIASLDVIVDKAGLRGPWTDDAARAAAGPFAPGARLTVLRGSVANLEIAMEVR